jgi:hypothetical protein
MMGSPKPHPHPLTNLPNLQKVWNNLIANVDQRAPRGLYWICGKQAYKVLPDSWFGSCMLDSIRPSFLLPLRQGENCKSPYMEKD